MSLGSVPSGQCSCGSLAQQKQQALCVAIHSLRLGSGVFCFLFSVFCSLFVCPSGLFVALAIGLGDMVRRWLNEMAWCNLGKLLGTLDWTPKKSPNLANSVRASKAQPDRQVIIGRERSFERRFKWGRSPRIGGRWWLLSVHLVCIWCAFGVVCAFLQLMQIVHCLRICTVCAVCFPAEVGSAWALWFVAK